MESFAVIGVGGWGQNHARVMAILKSEGLLEEVYIVDKRKERAKLIATRYGLPWTTEADEVFKNDSVKGVILSVPTKLHYELSIEAIKHGKDVLIEKPMTETVKEAEKVLEEAEKAGTLVMVGFLLRYSPAVTYVKELIRKGELGKILMVSAKRIGPPPPNPSEIDVVRDLAIHDVDLARFLAGAEPYEVTAYGGSVLSENVDYAFSLVAHSYENDSFPVALEANRATPYKIRRMEVTGTKASVLIDLQVHTVKVMKEDGAYEPRIQFREPLYLEDRNFVLASMGEEEPLVTGEDGLKALHVCEAILNSIKEGGKKVRLENIF